jgi:hypothetical protein
MESNHERGPRWSRRKFLYIAGGSAALQAGLRSANAQPYPARPVTLIVPYPAGTATDTTPCFRDCRAETSRPALRYRKQGWCGRDNRASADGSERET